MSDLSRPASAQAAFQIVEATFVAGAVDPNALPPGDLSEIAFAGRSNVGKSSCLNALLERNGLVRTSRTPGCTRQINMFRMKARSGAAFMLVDLPGYGFAQRSKKERAGWGPLLEGYLERRKELGALVVLVDVRRGVEDDDLALVEFFRAVRPSTPIVVIVTKTDKLPKSERKPALLSIEASLRPHRVSSFGVSAVTGEGREAVWKELVRVVTPLPGAGSVELPSQGVQASDEATASLREPR